jgi:hypothetical protein
VSFKSIARSRLAARRIGSVPLIGHAGHGLLLLLRGDAILPGELEQALTRTLRAGPTNGIARISEVRATSGLVRCLCGRGQQKNKTQHDQIFMNLFGSIVGITTRMLPLGKTRVPLLGNCNSGDAISKPGCEMRRPRIDDVWPAADGGAIAKNFASRRGPTFAGAVAGLPH